jgi:hypothetical protein
MMGSPHDLSKFVRQAERSEQSQWALKQAVRAAVGSIGQIIGDSLFKTRLDILPKGQDGQQTLLPYNFGQIVW